MDTSIAIGLIAGAFIIGYMLGSAAPRAPAVPPVPPDPEALEAVRPVLAERGKIAAIKAYRELTGVGLKDAKDAVETLEQR